MYARTNTVRTDPRTIDEGIAYVRDEVMPLVQGMDGCIGLVGVGVMTVRARRWSGWRRYAPLGLAVVYLAVLFVPAVAGSEPGALTETIWALGYSGLGLALLIEQGDRSPLSRGQYILGAAVVAAVITSAAVVTFSTSSTSSASSSVVPESTSGTVYGSADTLEQQVPSGTSTFGSADSLERQLPSGTATSGTVLRQGPIGSVDTVPSGTVYGSADSLDRQGQSGTPTFGSADSLERHAG